MDMQGMAQQRILQCWRRRRNSTFQHSRTVTGSRAASSGVSGPAAIEEVIPFFEAIVDRTSPDADTAILGLGVGWGRIARLFQGISTHERLYLADVDPEALEWCRQCGVARVPLLLEPNGVLPLSENSLDVVYSYSVFSHLAEYAARHWFAEIGRTLKPRGLFVFTTQSLRFLELVRACHERVIMLIRPRRRLVGTWEATRILRSVAIEKGCIHIPILVEAECSQANFTVGHIPPKWFDTEVGHLFEVEAYVDDRSMLSRRIYC